MPCLHVIAVESNSRTYGHGTIRPNKKQNYEETNLICRHGYMCHCGQCCQSL